MRNLSIPKSYGNLYINYHENLENRQFKHQNKLGEFLYEYKRKANMSNSRFFINTNRFKAINMPQNINESSIYNYIG